MKMNSRQEPPIDFEPVEQVTFTLASLAINSKQKEKTLHRAGDFQTFTGFPSIFKRLFKIMWF